MEVYATLVWMSMASRKSPRQRRPDRTVCPVCGEVIYLNESLIGGNQVLLIEEGYHNIVKTRRVGDSGGYFIRRVEGLAAASRKARASTKHYGELGRELEAAVKGFLSEHLPNEYRIDTGFVRSLEKPGWQSNQIDVLLSRSDICYPLATHHEYKVYPLESVISFVEVTSDLTRAKRSFPLPKPPASTILHPAYNATYPRFLYFAFTTS